MIRSLSNERGPAFYRRAQREFDRFADFGEDRARSLFRLGPFTSRRLGNKSESLRVERGTEQNGSGSL
jgi:hypothetical protein